MGRDRSARPRARTLHSARDGLPACDMGARHLVGVPRSARDAPLPVAWMFPAGQFGFHHPPREGGGRGCEPDRGWDVCPSSGRPGKGAYARFVRTPAGSAQVASPRHACPGACPMTGRRGCHGRKPNGGKAPDRHDLPPFRRRGRARVRTGPSTSRPSRPSLTLARR